MTHIITLTLTKKPFLQLTIPFHHPQLLCYL